MTRAEAEQVARIIYNVFEFEEQIDPRTIAKMFQYMGRVDPEGTHNNPQKGDYRYEEAAE